MMKKIIFTMILMLALTSCAGMPGGPASHMSSAPRDQIEAENRLMRNNLSLAMRENEVIKEENLRYKSEVTQLSDCVARLTADIETMEAEHRDRMAARKLLFDELLLLQSEREIDYCWTIDELRSANAAQGEETAAKLEEMAVALKRGDDAFRDAIAALKIEFKEKLEKYTIEASTLGRQLTETQTMLKDLGERVENVSTAGQETQVGMEDIRQSMEDIRRKTAELEQALHLLTSPVPAIADPAPAQGAGEMQESQ